MLKNYFKVAIRTLLKNKAYSFINIFGLSIGIALSLIIMLFVKSELSYDNFHTNSDSIYRAALYENYGEDEKHFNTITPALLGPELQNKIPEIINSIRISKLNGLVKTGDKSFPEYYHLVDPKFFELFNFPLISGNPKEVLSNPNSVVLTKSYSEKYFGNENAVGKTLQISLNDTTENFTVTGIASDVPINSSIQFNIIMPFQKMKDIFNDNALHNWTTIFCETYLFTQKGVSAKTLEAKMPALFKQILGNRYKPGTYNILFQPITDIHLDTKFPVGFEPISNPIYSYILSIIGLLILLIACINFITLSIGKSAGRAGEVGIRKVVGADRGQLIKQYLGESLLIVFISTIISILISELLLPYFNALAGKHLSLTFEFSTIVMLLILVFVTGAAAGIYPAIVLSSFKPIDVLKGKFSINKRSNLRRILICGQFIVAVILISSTMVVTKQLNFVEKKYLGFDKENIITIPTDLRPNETFRVAGLFKNELKSDPNIINVTSALSPLGNKWTLVGFDMPGGSYGRFYMNTVDYDYINTLKINLIKGRNFSKSFPSDYEQAVIVNQAFIRKFGLENSSEAKMPGNFHDIKIIGVVKDFNFESLYSKIEPALISLNFRPIFRDANDIDPAFNSRLIIRIKAQNYNSTLAKLKNVWTKIVPQIPFKSSFLNENIEKQYAAESRLTKIITSSSVLSIIITCLGLFGLTALISLQKTKEIGVRRLLGASVASIFKLLSKEFIWLILIAEIISIPVSLYLLNRWLNNFAYRIDVNLLLLISAGAIVIIISLITISFQVIKAASVNPAKSLKYE